MTRQELTELTKKKGSFLCVGLDSDITKIPKHLLDHEDPVFEFNKQIIDATIEYTVAYKPNTAFYESQGVKGWISLEKTINYLNSFGKEVFTIADAKRGDIGNTSAQYAKAFYETMNFDAITVAPYMGEDSVKPFLSYEGKWVVLLALTSNEGANDFQLLQPQRSKFWQAIGLKKKMGKPLYELVMRKSFEWASQYNMMFVVGATRARKLEHIRQIVPYHFLLIPGVGAQGGSLREVAKYGLTKNCGLLVNSSRNILFASAGEDFAKRAGESAFNMQKEMKALMMRYRVH
jgi:orotidine-5'-phosphate decarboxylase